jgi:Polyketide cyclase / dehydrase and lipid transport
MHQFRAEDRDFVGRARRVYVFEAPVAAPRERAFAAISADPSSWTWFPGLRNGRYESAAPHGVGAIRSVHMGGTIYRETIIGWDEPSLWAYRVDESSVPLAEALVEEWAILEDPVDPGSSIVRWTFALDPKPLFQAGAPAARSLMGGLFRRAMANLSNHLATEVDQPGAAR